MPLQNRVAPDGSLFSTGLRGTLMGNRGGHFHRHDQSLGTRRWASRQWICCVLAFRNRQRTVWGRGYTELFFCDEVSALAAGHRPCFECRSSDAKAFAAAVQRGLGAPQPFKAQELDIRLHEERLAGRVKRLHKVPEFLPDGAMVAAQGHFYALRQNRMLRWEFSGYRATQQPVPRDAALLTPPTMIAALHGGYQPRWHASAQSC